MIADFKCAAALFVLVAVLVYSITLVFGMYNEFSYKFAENDARYSYPQRRQQVSDSMLLFVMIVIPFVVIFASGVIEFLKESKKAADRNFGPLFALFTWLFIGVYLSIVITVAVTETIKRVVSEPRPSFFEACDYLGFQSNISFYNQHTVYGSAGNYENCEASESETKEARLGFPSGHASYSFAAMMSLVFLLQALRYRHTLFLQFSFLILATYISVSRVQDYKHSISDVLTGACLGMLVTVMVWKWVIQDVIQEQQLAEEPESDS